MIIKVKNKNKIYEINLYDFTQFCGLNFKLKDFLIKSIKKYFSLDKYKEYEEGLIDNVIFNDKEGLGRQYFDVIYINDKISLINQLSYTKNSSLCSFIKNVSTDIDVNKEIENISDSLNVIYAKFEEKLNYKIHFSHEYENILNIVSKTEVFTDNEEFFENEDNYNLFNIFFEVLSCILEQMPKKYLIIIDNIDHLIDTIEFRNLYLHCKEMSYKYGIKFLISSSINRFAIINQETLSGLHVINDEIFRFPEYEHIYEFIRDNYPVYFDENVDFYDDIVDIVQYIGNAEYMLLGRKDIFLKMFNKSLKVANIVKKVLNKVENTYILGKNDV